MLVMDGVLICFWSQLSISGDRGILHEENSWSFMFRKFRCFHCYIQCLYQWVKHLPASGSHCYLRVHRIGTDCITYVSFSSSSKIFFSFIPSSRFFVSIIFCAGSGIIQERECRVTLELDHDIDARSSCLPGDNEKSVCTF
ncbi:uncharacterized protein LOC132037947 isoform X2 [Lycium ferocissimum]|uniref:uncharacterized protein LOC132037947 isoform X2 n=1 Tax=Lycium ferocissimum TaxID=112874 RepID=UPI002815BCDC|nr:uncharacterized protein LOC132037947 isoform X2 [Lycium ferocissimum]